MLTLWMLPSATTLLSSGGPWCGVRIFYPKVLYGKFRMGPRLILAEMLGFPPLSLTPSPLMFPMIAMSLLTISSPTRWFGIRINLIPDSSLSKWRPFVEFPLRAQTTPIPDTGDRKRKDLILLNPVTSLLSWNPPPLADLQGKFWKETICGIKFGI